MHPPVLETYDNNFIAINLLSPVLEIYDNNLLLSIYSYLTTELFSATSGYSVFQRFFESISAFCLVKEAKCDSCV